MGGSTSALLTIAYTVVRPTSFSTFLGNSGSTSADNCDLQNLTW
jgi:hypothetical protein